MPTLWSPMAAPSVLIPRPGARLDSWLLQEPAGGGSFGIVFRAVHVEDASLSAAIKLAKHPLDARFEREAALLARLHHPHVPRLLSTGSWRAPGEEPAPYLVMSWAQGVCLYDWARVYQRTLTSRMALQLLAQVARALEATHAAGGVHRDVKGDNVHVSPGGHAMLLDFGSCWHEGARPLTRGNVPPGTEPYRSPQLLRFRRLFAHGLESHYPARPEDDIYAFGVMASFLLTGTYPPPLTDPDYVRLTPLPHARLPPFKPPCARAVVAPVLNDLVLRCLSDAPEARPTSAQLAVALEQAARTGGPELDLTVVRKPEELLTVQTPPPLAPKAPPERQPWRMPTWARMALAASVVSTFAVFWGRSHFPEPHAALTESPGGSQDAGTSGLGKEVRTREFNMPFACWDPEAVIAREMPREPLEGQRRPPCEPRMETAIHGGCWVEIARMKAPCGPKAFEYDGHCYIPSTELPKKPTSGGKVAR